jgi:hypothetical protein
MTRTTSRPDPTAPGRGVFDPDNFWGRVLPERFIIDADLPFEERVERAMQNVEATRFTPDEHERLRAVLGEINKAGEAGMSFRREGT